MDDQEPFYRDFQNGTPAKIEHKPNQTEQATRTLERYGRALKTAGTSEQVAGKAARAAGAATTAAGVGTEYAGKGISAAGQSISGLAEGLDSTGVGAVLGVPLNVLGGALSAGGKAVEGGGKGIKSGGRSINRAGQRIDAAGKKTKTAGKNLKQTGKDLQQRVKSIALPKNDKKAVPQQKNQPGLSLVTAGAMVIVAIVVDTCQFIVGLLDLITFVGGSVINFFIGIPVALTFILWLAIKGALTLPNALLIAGALVGRGVPFLDILPTWTAVILYIVGKERVAGLLSATGMSGVAEKIGKVSEIA